LLHPYYLDAAMITKIPAELLALLHFLINHVYLLLLLQCFDLWISISHQILDDVAITVTDNMFYLMTVITSSCLLVNKYCTGHCLRQRMQHFVNGADNPLHADQIQVTIWQQGLQHDGFSVQLILQTDTKHSTVRNAGTQAWYAKTWSPTGLAKETAM